jgi:hypothetical protein
VRALRCSRSRVHFAFLPSLSPRRLCVGSMQSIQSGYLTRASVILVLCMFDCCINAVADHPSRGAESFMPYVFLGVQVALQVINLLLIFMLFSGTYLFQVGLVGVQVREFRGLLGCALLYLLVYIAYAAYKIVRARCRAPPLLPPGAPSFHPLRPLPPTNTSPACPAGRRASYPAWAWMACGTCPPLSFCPSRKSWRRSSTTWSCWPFAAAWARQCGTTARAGFKNSAGPRPSSWIGRSEGKREGEGGGDEFYSL